MQEIRGNNWVMVTGATSGIGRALASHLSAAGQNVVAAARRPDRISPSAGPGRIVGIELDLTRPETIDAAARETARIVEGGAFAGLVNMAGVIVEGPLEALPSSELRRQFEINVIGPLALTRSLLPLLKQARGRIVNIGAISAHVTVPFYGPIAASKSALASLNDAMRLEFAPFGVQAILIEPGAMKTDIFSTARAARDAVLRAAPECERRYRPALAAMDRAFEEAGADDPQVVVGAVVDALSRRRPKPRVVVGKGTRSLLFLARLPIGTRDRLIRRALGLATTLRPMSERPA